MAAVTEADSVKMKLLPLAAPALLIVVEPARVKYSVAVHAVDG
jgi:hypothetical protein